MAGRVTRAVTRSTRPAAAARHPRRRVPTVVLALVLSMLATFLTVPPAAAYAAGVPAVTNPGAQTSPTKVALSLQMAAAGGTTPYTWSATGLPAGLTISTSGLISGTPSTAGTYSTTVTVKDATTATNTASFTWKTGVVPTYPGIRGTATGTAASLAMTAQGGTTPYTWSATALPTGLTINTSTGVISGTTTTAGTYTATVTARDTAAVTGATSFTWNVGPAPALASPGAQTSPSKVALSLTMSASGGAAPYVWTATSLPTGLSINSATGVVSGTPTTAGTVTATVTATDAKMIATTVSFPWTTGVVVTNPGARGSATGAAVTYPNSAAGGTTPYTWSATGLPAGLTINTSTGALTGTPTATGTYSTTITAKDTATVTGTAGFTWKTGPAPTVANPGAQTGTTGTAVSKTITASGGISPYTWSATGLPAGLTINATTAAITGTPATAGTATVTVTATDANKIPGGASFTWAVTAPVQVSNPGPQAATVGTAVSKTLAAGGGTGSYAWSAIGLPAGLSISSAGVITGTPTTVGTFTATFTATDAAGRIGTTTITWTVATALAVANPGTQQGTAGVASSLTLNASGGSTPYTWSATGLPAGLAIDSTTGVIGGTPAMAGSGTVTVTVTDGTRTASVTFTWTVAAAPKPATPTGVTAAAGGAQTVNLSWQQVAGAAGYQIVRDDVLVAKTGATGAFVDTQLDGAATYRYQVKAVDAAGATSDASATVTATLGALPAAPVNYARCAAGAGQPGCTYTASTPADAGYPDTAGRSLTDAVRGPVAYGPAWQGRNNTGAYSFTVDLGTTRAITEINSSWLQVKNDFVLLPATVTYATSTDGTTFTAAATISRPAVSDLNQIKTYRATNLATTARYVKIDVDGTGVWTMTDETEIRGTAPAVLTAPTGASAVAGGAQTVSLSWSAVTGATGYQVYRDGVVVAKPTGTTLVDTQLDPGTAYSYQVSAVDGSGTTSPLSAAVSATTAAAAVSPVNYARCAAGAGQPGCTYTASTPADAGYPDTAGRSLTDAVRGPVAYGPAWQGRNNTGAYSFTVDLGTTRAISEINSSWLQVKSDFVLPPSRVTYATSTDGVSFTQAAVIDRPNLSDANQIKTYRAINLATTARYVKIDVDGTGVWTMTDETEIRGTSLATPAMTATATGAQTVSLAWSAVPGATGYQVYRDGAVVAKPTGTTLVDTQLDPGIAYSYQVAATGQAGTTSPLSAAVTATTTSAATSPVNFARCGAADGQPGCTYTASTPADAGYPDTAGRSLTDAVRGPVAYGPAWQGRNNTGAYSFTVDLGTTRAITEINSSWLQVKNDFVLLPATVTYATSTDGQTFTTVASIARPAVSDVNQIKTYRALGLAATARYVQIQIDGADVWTLTDETEIRGLTLTGPLTLLNPDSQVSTVNAVVTRQLSAGGGMQPYRWSATDLPTGLSIDAGTGAITGTPTATASNAATVSVTDTTGAARSVGFPWDVVAALLLAPPSGLSVSTGKSVTQDLQAYLTGGAGPYTWSASGIPAGLTLDSRTGTVTGTASTLGTYPVQVTVIDRTGTAATATTTWTVTAGIGVTPVPAQTSYTGEPVTLQMATTGTGPYTWTASDVHNDFYASLPAGLTINTTTGLISGTPTATGTATSIEVCAASGPTRDCVYLDWTIRDRITVTGGPRNGTSAVGSSTSVPFTADGGIGAIAWSTTGLPAGLTLAPATGLVTGTPTTAASYAVTITATDVNGTIGKQSLNWTTAALLEGIPSSLGYSSAIVRLNGDYGAPYVIRIWDLTANVDLGSCPATIVSNCILEARSDKFTGTHTFYAALSLADGTNVQGTTTWTITAPSPAPAGLAQAALEIDYPGVSYRGGNREVGKDAYEQIYNWARSSRDPVDQLTVWAKVNQDLNTSPNYLEIIDSTTGETLRSCGSGMECPAVITKARAGHQFTVVLTDHSTIKSSWQLFGGGSPDFSAQTLSVSVTNGVISAATNRDIGQSYFNRMSLIDPAHPSAFNSDLTQALISRSNLNTTKACTATSCTWAPTFDWLVPGFTYVIDVDGMRSGSFRYTRPTPPPLLRSETQGGQNPAMPQTQVCSCEPVNTATGEFFENATDLTLPGKGPALAISRTYSSSAGTTDGPIGQGWTTNHAAALTIDDPAAAVPTTITVAQENGATVRFNHDGSGHYVPNQNVLATLVHEQDGTWTFTRRAQDVFTFIAAGRLLKHADLHGNTITYAYTSDGRLASATSSDGRALTYSWTGTRLSAVADSAGRHVTYSYDVAGQLATVTGVDGAVTRYGYNTARQLAVVTQPGGGFTRNTYDSSNRVVRQVDPAGQPTLISYNGTTTGTATTTVTAPDGTVTVSTFTTGYLTNKTMAAGTTAQQVWRYSVDGAGNTTAVTDPAGKTYSYAFDEQGNRTRQQDALGRVTTTVYNALNQPVSTTDPLGRTTTSTYNSTGDQLTTTSPDARVQRFTYNADGTVATSTAPAGEVTAFGYDSAGRQTSTTAPDGTVNTVAYNSAGQPVTTTDAAGNTTTSTYDPAGRLLSVTDPQTRTVRYGYDADGNRTTVTDPTGRTTTGYDALGRPVTVTDPAGATGSTTYTPAGKVAATTTDPTGRTTTYQYNPLGLLSSVTDPAGRTTSYGYDTDGRPVSTTLPSGATSSTGYDAAGQVTTSTDATSKTTTYTYDNAGQLTATTDQLQRVTSRTYTADGLLASTVGADNGTTSYSYNSNGQLTKTTNPDGADTSYTYNSLGQQSSRTQPGGLITHYSYDPAGRPKTTTNPDGSTVTKTYNSAGDLTGVDYSNPNTPDVSYTYDTAGRQATMTDGTGTTTYTYDATGRLTGSTDGTATTVGYGYDPAGRLTSLTYPGGNKLTYGYDTAGQMTSATDWAGRTTAFVWRPDGQLATQQTPNGVTSTYGYDNAGRTLSIGVAKNSTALATYNYAYDNAGQLSADADNGYTFDPIGQLKTSTGTTATGAYSTTPGGNLTGLPGGTTLTYNAARQLTGSSSTSSPTVSYQYDGNGNRTSSTTAGSPATTYRYQQTGLLAGVTTSTGTTVDYTTGGDGLRHTRTTGGTTSRYTWATNGSMPLILDDGVHRYLYGPGLTPYAQIDTAGTIQYLHTDNLGSVRLITDTTGTVVGSNTYNPRGERVTHTGAGSNIGFTGAWTDPTTGLVYLRVRDYDPTTGQFLTIDPLADATGQPYAYAGNNPLQYTDPAGLCADCNWLENFVLSGPSNLLADNLQHGPGGQVVSFFEGVGDAASFGLTGHVRDAISPGSSCLVRTDSWAYTAGEVSTYLIPAGGAAKTVYGAYTELRVARAAGGAVSALAAGAAEDGTGLVEGANGALRDPATGRFASNPDRVAPEPSSGLHGNSRLSDAPTSLYRLEDLNENYLKTGITSNPGGRYTQDFMSDKFMNIINVGSRSNMLDLERMIVEIDPGPLNFERWAGTGR